jgi:unspecific monooxygenase
MYFITSYGLVLGACLALFSLLYWFLLYPIFFSPLGKIPAAHWSAKFSSIWSLWMRYQGTELDCLLKAHESYGPIVQVGPKDLSISSYKNGVRKVYDAGFGKPTSWFSIFNYFGYDVSHVLDQERYRKLIANDLFNNRSPNAFTSIGSSEHRMRRRRIAALYSKASLLGSQQMYAVSRRIMYDRAVPRLDGDVAKGVNVDTLELSYCLCADYLSSFLFGFCNGTNYLTRNRAAISEWRLHYENTSCQECVFPQEMPIVTQMLARIGIDVMPATYRASRSFLEGWMRGMAVKADQMIHQRRVVAQHLSPEDDPEVYETMKAAVEKGLKPLGRRV